MFARLRRLLNRFFSKSRTINNEPLNKVSLIVIILIDIFILFNVFSGLDDIGRWYLSPEQAYPCYSDWKSYQAQTDKDKDYQLISSVLSDRTYRSSTFRKTYQQEQPGHLGTVSATCLDYADYQDKLYTPENRKLATTIDQKQTKISALDQTNRNIRAQYDSTLLEKIAGQPRERSINAVGAEKAKQELDQNNRSIATLKQEIAKLKEELVNKPESASFIVFLQNSEKFKSVETAYQQAAFWYPSIQLAFQALFLLPLIAISLSVHTLAQRRGYGLIALISWHLLVIFFIPLILKVFEFLQVGALFQFLFDIVKAIFGGLLFLISYLYILLIPVIGFAIIKFFQKFVFNTRIQAANRVQKNCCIRCAKRLHPQDPYCPHCGYYQYLECPHCHAMTYKYLPYCKQCGQTQNFHPTGSDPA